MSFAVWEKWPGPAPECHEISVMFRMIRWIFSTKTLNHLANSPNVVAAGVEPPRQIAFTLGNVGAC